MHPKTVQYSFPLYCHTMKKVSHFGGHDKFRREDLMVGKAKILSQSSPQYNPVVPHVYSVQSPSPSGVWGVCIVDRVM